MIHLLSILFQTKKSIFFRCFRTVYCLENYLKRLVLVRSRDVGALFMIQASLSEKRSAPWTSSKKSVLVHQYCSVMTSWDFPTHVASQTWHAVTTQEFASLKKILNDQYITRIPLWQKWRRPRMERAATWVYWCRGAFTLASTWRRRKKQRGDCGNMTTCSV